MAQTDRSPSGDLGGAVPPPNDDDLLTVAEVAAMWRCSHMAVRRRIADGSLKAIRQGRFVRVARRALREYIDQHSAAPTAPTAGAAGEDKQ